MPRHELLILQMNYDILNCLHQNDYYLQVGKSRQQKDTIVLSAHPTVALTISTVYQVYNGQQDLSFDQKMMMMMITMAIILFVVVGSPSVVNIGTFLCGWTDSAKTWWVGTLTKTGRTYFSSCMSLSHGPLFCPSSVVVRPSLTLTCFLVAGPIQLKLGGWVP